MRRALAAVTIMGKCAERVLPRGEKTMNREMDMAEVSDGKLYGLDDMVKADGKPEVISASRVRKLLDEQGVTDEVLSLVPECTAKYLKESFK